MNGCVLHQERASDCSIQSRGSKRRPPRDLHDLRSMKIETLRLFLELRN
ncbi:unnamed protein product [Amoebophrya sp. A25]|nr:unnamed protein product [Amoebophrya sp. A25]|eukprot:GSA25T00008632001.1